MKLAPDLHHTRITTAQGPVWLAATAAGLAGLWFEGQKHFPLPLATLAATTVSATLPAEAAITQASPHAVLQLAAAQFFEYLSGHRTVFDLPLDLSAGTTFQQAVWRALLDLPCGHTTTYAALSSSIGRPSAVRAVAAAIGRNPISVVVPCHRVLGTNGSLTGYAGGLPRKAALLALEQSRV